ncbi:MAG: patatin-like phospholipase family protein [Polyangia bacterium]
MRGLLVAALLCVATTAHADTVTQGPRLPVQSLTQRPLGITLSGGVSLGSYEAGFLHYTITQLRRIGVRPRVLTGTSAGSINAFVGILEACSNETLDPTKSLLYRTWVPTGIDQLFDPAQVTDSSLFTRAGMQRSIDMLREAWKRGLAADCDMRFGTAVTLQKPQPLELGLAGVNIPRMTERFLIRVKGHGAGALPTLENARTEELGRSLVLLPLDGSPPDPFQALVDVLMASSGFPLAFPPQAVHHCNKRVKADEVPTCTLEESTETKYIDGGFFDNRPIGMAFSVLREQAEEGVDPALLFVDPSLHDWPRTDDVPTFSGVVGLVAHSLFDFIDTAMSAELERLLSRQPALERDLYLGMSHYPPASQPMGAFFGFMESELRRFDFYLGMFNARRLTAIVLGVATRDLEDGSNSQTEPAIRPLGCMRALWDSDGDPKVMCAGDELMDIRILAQVAGEQVWNECSRSPLGKTSSHPVCVAAAKNEPPPQVPGVVQRGDFRQKPHEAEYEWLMRRLGDLHFWFRDLGLTRAQSRRGMLELRHKLGIVIDAFAGKQGAASIAFEAVGEFGLNQLTYIPPRHLVHFALGDRAEVGYSFTDPTSVLRGIRFSTALALRGLDATLSSRQRYFGLAPVVGVEFEPLPLSRTWIQARLALHAGYMFSTGDGFLRGTCHTDSDRLCSRPVTEAVASLSILTTFRLQLAASWFPAVRPGEKNEWALGPALGIQLPVAGR